MLKYSQNYIFHIYYDNIIMIFKASFIKGRVQKKNSKIGGFCPKRREGVISKTQFLHTFNLGLLSEEGGGTNLGQNPQFFFEGVPKVRKV